MTNYRMNVDQAGRPYFYFTGSPNGFQNGMFAGFNSSQLSTHQINFGSLNVFINGNDNIFLKIFGSGNAGAVIGFLVASTNGMIPGIEVTGGYVPSKFLKANHGFSMTSYLNSSLLSNVGALQNPCSVGLNAPVALNRDPSDPSKGSTSFNFNAAMNTAAQWKYLAGTATGRGVALFSGVGPFGNRGAFDIYERTQNQANGNIGYGKYYENYGNFLIGAAAYTGGFTLQGALQMQGFGQMTNRTLYPMYGSWSFPGVIGGTGFYGDDPKDQFWTTRGYEYMQNRCRG
jgi:hypothetical protein